MGKVGIRDGWEALYRVLIGWSDQSFFSKVDQVGDHHGTRNRTLETENPILDILRP